MKIVISSLLFVLFTSCAQVSTPSRRIASTNCYESVRAEYQSYFDSYEKCIEKPIVK